MTSLAVLKLFCDTDRNPDRNPDTLASYRGALAPKKVKLNFWDNLQGNVERSHKINDLIIEWSLIVRDKSVFYARHLATIGKNTGLLITDQGTKFNLYYNKISGYDIYYCILNYLWNIY